jgi:hypothetical protein
MMTTAMTMKKMTTRAVAAIRTFLPATSQSLSCPRLPMKRLLGARRSCQKGRSLRCHGVTKSSSTSSGRKLKWRASIIDGHGVF